MIKEIKTFFTTHYKGIVAGASAVSGLALSAGQAFATEGDLADTVSSASGQFLSTTGFSYTDLVTQIGDWIKMFLGTGLGLVDSLLPWIIALIVFGVIISLVYKAMRFLHILR